MQSRGYAAGPPSARERAHGTGASVLGPTVVHTCGSSCGRRITRRTDELVNDAEHLWNAVAQVLRAQVSEAVWHSSFQDARPLLVTQTHLTMAVPSSHVRDRLEGRYMALIRDA